MAPNVMWRNTQTPETLNAQSSPELPDDAKADEVLGNLETQTSSPEPAIDPYESVPAAAAPMQFNPPSKHCQNAAESS